MDRYIEVVGEGRFFETASVFIAEITLQTQAVNDEMALRDVSALCAEALVVLREAGITDDEITEGGATLRRSWQSKKQEGQNAVRKLILKVADFGKLNRVLEQLEPLQSRNKERRTISFEMQQPEFKESIESKSTALAEAFEQAKAKASCVATAMGCQLGRPIHLEEGGWVKRNSGFSGDEDWGGDSSRFGGDLMMAVGGRGHRI